VSALDDIRARADVATRSAVGALRFARSDVPHLLAAVDAALALAEQWRYKGEFDWGTWQAGEGPDFEGHVLNRAAAELRAAVTEALEGK
jgi:hypothetical protein